VPAIVLVGKPEGNRPLRMGLQEMRRGPELDLSGAECGQVASVVNMV
jgi:hypothetical protein